MNLLWSFRSRNRQGRNVTEFSDENRLLELHKRLLNGDRVASAEIAELLLVRMTNEMSRRFPKTDVQIVCDGVTDAILEFCANASRFNRSKGVPLYRFIMMAARRNVLNLLRSEVRRKNREETFVQLTDA